MPRAGRAGVNLALHHGEAAPAPARHAPEKRVVYPDALDYGEGLVSWNKFTAEAAPDGVFPASCLRVLPPSFVMLS